MNANKIESIVRNAYRMALESGIRIVGWIDEDGEEHYMEDISGGRSMPLPVFEGRGKEIVSFDGGNETPEDMEFFARDLLREIKAIGPNEDGPIVRERMEELFGGSLTEARDIYPEAYAMVRQDVIDWMVDELDVSVYLDQHNDEEE